MKAIPLTEIEMLDFSKRLLVLGYNVPVASIKLWNGQERFDVRRWLKAAERYHLKGRTPPTMEHTVIRYYQRTRP